MQTFHAYLRSAKEDVFATAFGFESILRAEEPGKQKWRFPPVAREEPEDEANGQDAEMFIWLQPVIVMY